MYRGRAIREFAKGDATKADVAYWVSGGDSVAGLVAADAGGPGIGEAVAAAATSPADVRVTGP